MDVSIPKGAQDGQQLPPLEGKGKPGLFGSQAGDLILSLEVLPPDTQIRLNITEKEAQGGCEKTVPVDGHQLRVTIPAGVQDEQQLRLEGQGTPLRDKAGDLIVTLHISEDVHRLLKLTWEEANQGCKKTVSVYRRKVSVTIPPGVHDGQQLPPLKGQGKGGGDLIITVQVQQPKPQPQEVKLPELGENLKSGVVVRVLVSVGDTIAENQPILEIETDKAIHEVLSTIRCVVQAMHVQEGEQVQVGQPILTVDAEHHEGKPGDLVLTLRVKTKTVPGEDVLLPLELTWEEAKEGCQKTVPVGRRKVVVDIKAGAQDGRQVREKGKGKPGKYGGEPGDLIVTLRVKPKPVQPVGGEDVSDILRRYTMKVCPMCGKEYEAHVRFCPFDGTALKATQKDSPQAPFIGREVGGRRILEKLGEGGMGVVYKAHHPLMNRDEALKMMRQELLSNPSSVQRFLREAELVGRLDHTNVVKVHDRGKTDDNYFMAMEYVAGENLRKLLEQEGHLDPHRAVGLMVQVCEALEAAHQQGIVHRDLKPENVMVTAEEKAKVLDFGIAKLLTPEGETTGRLTQTQVLFGSPRYMSPEQARGEAEVDARADIYSAGVMLYEMLSGKALFEAQTPMSWALAHVHETPVPLRQRAGGGGISEALEAVVMRCLEKEPSRRWGSARELEDALKEALEAEERGVLLVSTEPAGAEVGVDEKEYGLSPKEIGKLPAGKHHVRARKAGYKEQQEEVRVEKGERKEVRLVLQKEPLPKPVPPPVPKKGIPRWVWGVLGAVLGAALILVMLLVAFQKEVFEQAMAAYNQQSYSEAAKWFHKAVKQGNPQAQFYLGLIYEKGRGVPQDNAQAMKWYSQAAERGVLDAQDALTRMRTAAEQEKGYGVSRSLSIYKEQEKGYAENKAAGDSLFSQGMYAEAKRKYGEAQKYKPTDSYVTKRIQECENKMAAKTEVITSFNKFPRYINSDPGPLQFLQTKRTNPKDDAVMVRIPAGEFLMGTSEEQIDTLLNQFPILLKQFPYWKRSRFDAEKPQHRVYLDEYWIYKHEVTVAQYRKFSKETGRQMPNALGLNWQDDHPIVNVTWDDAVAYCQWAGVQLPTEAQWEKAARGTDGRIYPWGNEAPDAGGRYRANYDAGNNVAEGYRYTAPVGSFPLGASPYGLMDMGGNVWECCADWWYANYYQNSPNRNPQGPSSGTGRVLRGGSWGDDPRNLRAAGRIGYYPDDALNSGGFRCSSPRFPR